MAEAVLPLRGEAVAFEHDLDTVPPRQFERFLDGHSRTVHFGGFAGPSSEAVSVDTASDGGVVAGRVT